MEIWPNAFGPCVMTNTLLSITHMVTHLYITSQSRVIFRISSSIFISLSTSLSALIAGLSYTSACGLLLFSADSLSVCSWSSTAIWQHLQQQQHLAVHAPTTLSQGAREWAQRGRKSQDRSAAGRHPGFRFCSTLITMMMISMRIRGTPTPTRTCQPARDRLKTRRGRTKKQTMM